MEVLRFFHSQAEPLLLADVRPGLHSRDRGRADKTPVPFEQCKAYQVVLVGFIEKKHLAVQIVPRQVLVLDHIVVHGVTDSAHAGQIVLEISFCLGHELLRALSHQYSRTLRETIVEDKA